VNKAEIVFNSYDEEIEKQYNIILEDKQMREALHNDSSYIREVLEKNMEQWETRPIAELDNITPAEYFDALDSTDIILDNFKIGACICEANLPGLFIKKLDEHKLSLVQEMISMAINTDLMKNNTEYFIPLVAMRMLGRWQVKEAAEALVKFITFESSNDELFLETAADTIYKIGQPAVELLLDRLEGIEEVKEGHKYLMSALTKICRNNKTDRVYKCLKNIFLKMDDKELGAAYIAEYGDGRVIPALRGYLIKNNGKIRKAEFFEIMSAIQKLGGNVDDLQISYINN